MKLTGYMRATSYGCALFSSREADSVTLWEWHWATANGDALVVDGWDGTENALMTLQLVTR